MSQFEVPVKMQVFGIKKLFYNGISMVCPQKFIVRNFGKKKNLENMTSFIFCCTQKYIMKYNISFKLIRSTSSHTDRGGVEALEFSILHSLDQLIQQPTRVPDRHDQASNILDLFFISNCDLYTYSVSSPLGSSDHCFVTVTSSYAPPPPLPSTSHRL